jgi:hypothetical protein
MRKTRLRGLKSSVLTQSRKGAETQRKKMQRRRWLQFSLRFLLAIMLASACFAWCFRPGVVRPEFSLDRLFPAIDDGNKVVIVHFRVRNAGPDSIWLDPSAYRWNTQEEGIIEIDENGEQIEFVGLGGSIGSSHGQRIQLRPGESTLYVVHLNAVTQGVTLGVDISDHRDRRVRQVWSQNFAIDKARFLQSP